MTAQPAPPYSAQSPAPRDLFSAYSFDTLISGAARLRPQGLALVDRNHSVPFDLLAGQAAALARLLAECGLKPGERLLLIGGAETTLVVAIVAALRGGFEPALAPLDLEPGRTWRPMRRRSMPRRSPAQATTARRFRRTSISPRPPRRPRSASSRRSDRGDRRRRRSHDRAPLCAMRPSGPNRRSNEAGLRRRRRVSSPSIARARRPSFTINRL